MNKRTKQDYLDMLENTVNYYSEDTTRRATSSDYGLNSCVYISKDGKNCAVGRWINYDNFSVEDHNDGHAFLDLIKIDDKTGYQYTDEELFVPEAQGFYYRFWADLQDLHDANENWNKSGLTDVGKLNADKIKERLELGYYGNF